jgi:hypothetical protein
MVNVVVERQFAPAINAAIFQEMAAEGAECMPLYRVKWHESLLAEDGRRLVCRFESPDVESVRIVAKEKNAIGKVLWSGTVHDTGRDGVANVMVERRFDGPVTVESLQVIEDAAAWCMEQYKVTFLRTFFSADQRRMLCLYEAPDAESVRLAQHEAKMPVERVWACRGFAVADFV